MDKLGVSTNFGWKLIKEENRIMIFFAFRDTFRFFLSKNSRKKKAMKKLISFLL